MPVHLDRRDRCVVLEVQGRVGPWTARRLARAVARVRHDRPDGLVVIDLRGAALLEERHAFRLSSAWGRHDDVLIVAEEPDRMRAVLRDVLPGVEVPRVVATLDEAGEVVRDGPGQDRLPSRPADFRHEAFLYRGEAEFVEQVSRFLLDGLEAGEAVVAALPRHRIRALRRAMGPAAAEVHVADLAELGRNPAMVLRQWQAYVAELSVGGRELRGVTEPIPPRARTPELVERERHELLVNRVLAGAGAVWLMCAYDLEALPNVVVRGACRTHPHVFEAGRHRRNPHHLGGDEAVQRALRAPLGRPPTRPDVLHFDAASIHEVSRSVARHGAAAGLWADELRGLALATAEVAASTVLHGDGTAVLRVWTEDGDTLVCEVEERTPLDDPLAGLVPPSGDAGARPDLWRANQLCDLVQVRSDERGTVVRLHQRGKRLRPGIDGWDER